MRQYDDLLLAKVREGVEVRLLYDAVGSARLMKNAHRAHLRSGGVEVEPFSRLLRVHTISYRNHRKIAVVDGRVAYVGGLNMGKEHLQGFGQWRAWRDIHVRMGGEAARSLSAAFLVDWYHATRRALLDARYVPPVEESHGRLPVQFITSGPDSEHEATRQMYFHMVTSAQKHVYIASPFFVLDQSMSEALKAAAMSGVDVRIMVAPHGAGDNPIPYWAAYTYMLDMAGTGVKIYLYQAGYMHSKAVSVDGVVCSIGSANMDMRSFNVDYEITALIYDPAIAQVVERRFCEDLRNCEMFDPAAYLRRPFGVRLRDASSRLLSPLL
jgi:cardiolipin synthase